MGSNTVGLPPNVTKETNPVFETLLSSYLEFRTKDKVHNPSETDNHISLHKIPSLHSNSSLGVPFYNRNLLLFPKKKKKTVARNTDDKSTESR
jgi:hypothetical protein